jgi:hypothetical protein
VLLRLAVLATLPRLAVLPTLPRLAALPTLPRLAALPRRAAAPGLAWWGQESPPGR